jgi:2-(1,2-epoxy-1,2-dihydrophenyl)acetyl-CoA isomerase
LAGKPNPTQATKKNQSRYSHIMFTITRRNQEMTDQTVLLNIQDSVATITLNRPEVYNALNQPMAEALVRAIQMCMDDDHVRAVILTGAGRGFCAGGDMKAAWEHIQAGGDPQHFFRDLTVPLHRAITDMRLMEKPIVAAINGAAGGAGMSLAAACDLRLAVEGAKFKQAYTSIGLVPDGGWTAIVPQIIGPAKAAELLLLDPVLDAQQALTLGLVHEVVPGDRLMKRACETATGLAQGPATALGGAKTLVNAALYPMLEVQLERERQRIIAQGGTADFREGVFAFVEKRKPHFRG